MAESPYKGKRKSSWPRITNELIDTYPIKMADLSDVAQYAFKDVFRTTVGTSQVPLGEVNLSGGTRGGIIGGFFEYLFTERLLSLTSKEPKWRFGAQNLEPDLVYSPDPFYSLELKTSSQRNTIHGSSSKAHKEGKFIRKDGSGFYLVVNYVHDPQPLLTHLRFGWLDDSDWRGSKSAASASSRVIRENADLKLQTIYSSEDPNVTAR